jgi:hypothetical protein
MKILNAGAPEGVQHMFEWTENTEGNPADNAFLTNPQAVYSASKIISDAFNGNKEAQESIQAKKISQPNTNYYKNINILLSFRHNKWELFNQIKSNLWSYLKTAPSLIYDLMVTENTQKRNSSELELDNFFNKLDEAIKAQKYLLIENNNPHLAIHTMKDGLQSSKCSLPFFSESTLKIVRDFILELEAKSNPTMEDIEHISNYNMIINERDERLHCVEKAVYEGKNPSNYLLNKKDNSTVLVWKLPNAERAELLVNKFYEQYNQLPLGNRSTFPLSHTPPDIAFLFAIDNTECMEEKLNIIYQHVSKNHQSKEAMAWEQCRIQDDELKGFLDKAFDDDLHDIDPLKRANIMLTQQQSEMKKTSETEELGRR